MLPHSTSTLRLSSRFFLLFPFSVWLPLAKERRSLRLLGLPGIFFFLGNPTSDVNFRPRTLLNELYNNIMNRFVYDNGYITMKRLNCTLLRARLTACCLLLPLQPPPFFTPIGSLLLSFVRTYAGRSVGVAKAITNAEKITKGN